MSSISFPSSPEENDIFTAKTKTLKYFDSKWKVVKTGIPDFGVIDPGFGDQGPIVFNGGVAASDFSGLGSVDGGSP
jgi:hypothetical protein